MKLLTRSVFLLALLAALASSLSLKAQPSGLVGWWSGQSNLVDSVNGHNGFINAGINYMPGTNGQAFDIEGGLVVVPDTASLRPAAAITLQAWVKAQQPGTFRYVMAKTHAGTGVSYAIYTGGGGGAIFFVNLLNPTNNTDVTLLSPAAPSTIWDNNWHQLTGVFDGTVSRLYVDGIEVGTGSTNTDSGFTNISYVTPQQFVMGSYRTAGDLPYVGLIDNAKIFNVAMTATDVADTFANSSSAATTNGLVSWYRGEGNAQDSWGNNHGTTSITGARFFDYTSQGKIGAALFPHGSEAIIPDAPDLQPTNLTLQVWAKSVTPSTFRYLVNKSRAATGASFANSWAIYTGSSGGAYFFVNITDGVSDATILSPTVAPATVWDGAYHLLTGTWDGSVSRLYIDGIEQGTGTTNLSLTASNIDYTISRPLLFGDYQTPPGLPFNGFEDEIQLYNRALSPSEVLSNYTSVGGLVSWWNANTNSNDSVSVNHGTLAGSANYVPSRTKLGGAFNTVAGAVIVPNAPSLQVSNITLQAEVGAVFPGTNRYIISKSFTTASASYAFYTGPSGGLQFYVNLNGTKVSSPDAGTAVWDGNFHIVNGTYDGATVRLFVDGKEVGSGTSASGQIQYGSAHSSGELLFGDFIDTLSTNSNFAGIIDEVKLYRTALPASQIAGNAFQNVLIIAQPANTGVVAGQNTTLSVTAQGPGPITYQWLFNGSNIAGATASSLTLTNVQNSQAGQYQVRINTGGALYINNTITNNFTPDTIVGKALQFGAGSLVDVSNTPALETQDFTVQLYARAVNPGTFKWMLSKSRDPSFFSASYGLYTGASGGAIWFVVLQPPPFSTNSYSFVPIDAGTNIWDGKWHQLTGVWAAGQYVSLYLDGVLVNTVDTFGGTVDYQQYFLNGDLILGDVLSPASTFHFPGDMDEVKFFDHALTADDVMNSYTNQSGFGATNGLLYWYQFNNNAADSKSGNDGKIIPAQGTQLSDVATLTVLAPPATLINSAIVGGNFTATVSGPSGQSYILQHSSTLTGGWTPVVTNTIPFTFSDPIAPSPSSRFYRAVKQ